jgi:hypothetical protein
MGPATRRDPAAVILALAGSLLGCTEVAVLGVSPGPDGGGLDAEVATIADPCGNGVDDDLDGRIDDGCPCGPGEVQSCFGGAIAQRGVGACTSGIQICPPSRGEWGDWGDATCEGDVLPATEACDGLDRDCDGALGESCSCAPGETAACGAGSMVGVCRAGAQRCGESATWDACEGAVAPSSEVCANALDDDCDGVADELCGCVPRPEVCGDAMDNDCDGAIDEPACEGAWPPVCGTEGCGDGLDGDCDALIDEDCDLCDAGRVAARWQLASTIGAPSVRGGQAEVWSGTRLLVWSGVHDASDYADDGAIYDLASDTWAPVSASGAPAGRIGALGTWTGSAFAIYGGERGTPIGDGALYDPVAMRWTPLPLRGPLLSIGTAAIAWDGGRLCVAGLAGGAPTVACTVLSPDAAWLSSPPFPGDPSTLETPPLAIRAGFVFAGLRPEGASPTTAPWWHYDIATWTWRELPGRPVLDPGSPDAAQRVENDSMLDLGDGRIASLGERRQSLAGLSTSHDEIAVLELATGRWAVTYPGERLPDLLACAGCDAMPEHCAGCPETAARTDWSNHYGSARALPCGPIFALHGARMLPVELQHAPVLRGFDFSLTSFDELALPYDAGPWTDWSRQASALALGSDGRFVCVNEVFGPATGEPLQYAFLR